MIEIGLPDYARGLNVPDAKMFGPVIIRSGDPLFGDANGLLRLDPKDQGLAVLVDRTVADRRAQTSRGSVLRRQSRWPV